MPFTCGICPNQIPALIRGGNWGQTEQFHQRCKREQRTRIITKTLNAPKWSCVNSPFLPSLTFNFFGFPILSHAFQSVCAQLECCNTHTKPQTSHLSFFRLILCFPHSMRSYSLFSRPRFGVFWPLNCLWPFVFGCQTWASRPICRLRCQWHKDFV